MKKNFCLAPWHHGFVHADGTIRACCVSHDILGDTQKGDTIQSVWNSEPYQKLRRTFLLNRTPEGCSSCTVKEKMSAKSTRNFLNKQIKNNSKNYLEPHSLSLSNIAKEDFISLDIALSNKCNLQCRICGPRASTKWIHQISRLVEENHPFLEELEPYDISHRLVQQNLELYKPLLQNAKSLKFLELKGGEPFLNSENLRFLQFLIDQGMAKDIELIYSSNGTVIQQEVREYFPRFKKISLTISLDGIDKLHDYIRGPEVSLVEISKNIEFYKLIPNLYLNIHFTLCAFNIFGISQFVDWFDQLNIKYSGSISWGVGTLAYPKALRVSSVPTDLRIKAISKLPKSSHENIENIRTVLSQSLPPSEVEVNQMINYIKKLDHVRATSFIKTVPEYKELFLSK